MKSNFIPVLGVPFINTTRKKFVDTLHRHMINNEKKFVVTANPEIVMHAREDAAYKKCLDKADYITADGIGVVKASGITGQPLLERVSGFDIMLELLDIADKENFKVFFLGAAENVLTETVARVQSTYPGIQIAGSRNGFFDWSDPALADQIKQGDPDLVLVALGFPRQEQWISANIDQFDKGVFIGVGGSFDVFSGNVRRAPDFWVKLNIEWLYRLLKQPSRFKRMLVLPKFALVVIFNKVFRKNEK